MMSIAELSANQSKARNLKVGAVFSKDGRPLCTGWNGLLEGITNDICEHKSVCSTCKGQRLITLISGLDICPICNGTGYTYKTKPEVIHAEMNALRYMAKAGISTNGTTLYITHSPCINCAKHLAGIGLKRLVYKTEYKDLTGVEFLKTHSTMEIEQWNK